MVVIKSSTELAYITVLKSIMLPFLDENSKGRVWTCECRVSWATTPRYNDSGSSGSKWIDSTMGDLALPIDRALLFATLMEEFTTHENHIRIYVVPAKETSDRGLG